MSKPSFADLIGAALDECRNELAVLSEETSIRFMSAREIIEIHDRIMAQHGGLSGVRDRNLLESSVARPMQMMAYENVRDIHRLAAIMCSSLIRNHGFIDGNKRTAFLSMRIFAAMNDLPLELKPTEQMLMVQDLAAGNISDEDFVNGVAPSLVFTSSFDAG